MLASFHEKPEKVLIVIDTQYKRNKASINGPIIKQVSLKHSLYLFISIMRYYAQKNPTTISLHGFTRD